MLWILFQLMHTLEVDRNRTYDPLDPWPSLEYHWLWALICLGIVWGCGLGFYFSVYAFAEPFYYAPHVLAWAVLGTITFAKLPDAFPLRAEQKATVLETESSEAVTVSTEPTPLRQRH